MRWSVAQGAALVATLVLAGCASDGPPPEPVAGIPATDLEAGNVTQTMFPLAFGGGTREAELSISETFAPNDACFFGFPDCLGASVRSYDLTSIVPAEVPVEMTIQIDSGADLDLGFELVDAQFIQVSDDDNGNGGGNGGGSGGQRFDAVLVRAQAGTIKMSLRYGFPSPDGAQAVTVTGLAHTVTRSDVVPALLPVAIELEPGDVVNATADGLEHFAAFPPSGPALRALQFPFTITVPEDAPSGTWFLVGAADEALRLTGPNRTLSARLLDFMETAPVPVSSNQATTFTMEVAGQPLLAGVVVESTRSVNGFFGVMDILGAHTVALVSPDNVQVLQDGDDQAGCVPWCSFNPIGSFSRGYQSAFLDEHLMPGTFTATIEMGTSNNIQAFGWALSIRPTA